MNQKFQRFGRAVADYTKFKDQFNLFCKKAKEILHDNPHLPGVSFTFKDGGVEATLTTLDQTFIIRLKVIGRNGVMVRERIGVLAAYLALANGDETLIWRTFFDSAGNARDKPDADFAAHHISENEFVQIVVGEIGEQYFAGLVKEFKVETTPQKIG